MSFSKFIFILLIFVGRVLCAQSLCITKDGANLRNSPKQNASVSWKVPKYMPFFATGKKSGEFFEVTDVDSEKHWVHRSEISWKLNCLVVKASMTTLRAGPGKNFPRSPAAYADKYSAFLDLGGEDGWTLVQSDEGEKSWINLDTTWKPHRTMKMKFKN